MAHPELLKLIREEKNVTYMHANVSVVLYGTY